MAKKMLISLNDEAFEMFEEIRAEKLGIGNSALVSALMTDYKKANTTRPVGRPKKENEVTVGYWFNPVTKQEEPDFFYIDQSIYERIVAKGGKIERGEFNTGAVTSREMMYNLTHNPELWKTLDYQEKELLKTRHKFVEPKN